MKFLDKNLLQDAYYDMLLCRVFEEAASVLYRQSLIGGFCHLYIGQEAIATSIKYAIEKDDAVITSYRDHGIALALGTHPNAIMAELLGRATGSSMGKGGSMHIFDSKNGFYGGHGIVGAQVPIGTGIGFSFKYKNQPNVCIVMFGDGAINQGQVYESFNMAKLWNLPVLYIVENNEYSMGTSVERGCSNAKALFKRGESFGIDGVQVDGMDFIATYNIVQSALHSVRACNGPILIETKTYRYKGHSMSDPAKYRTKEEVEHYKQCDPIERLKDNLINNHGLVKKDFDHMQQKIETIVKNAENFAKNSPEPNISALYTQIYAV